jgi:hypothetical protein
MYESHDEQGEKETVMVTDWQSGLVEFLIDGGVIGRKQAQIVSRFDGYATAKRLEQELEFLAADDRVQKFNIPAVGRRGGRRFTVWRATTKILEVAT